VFDSRANAPPALACETRRGSPATQRQQQRETASTILTCPDLTHLLLDHALHLASLHYCSLLALIHSLLTRIFSGCL
jgi:hypothetical protein